MGTRGSGEGFENARVLLFPQTTEVRFQTGGSTTWLLMPGTATSQNLGRKPTTGPSPSTIGGCVEGLNNLGPSEGLLSGKWY